MRIYVIECGKDTKRNYDITGFTGITLSDGYNCKHRTKEEVEKEINEYGNCVLRCITSGRLKLTIKYKDREEVINEGVYNSSSSGIIIK